MGVTISNRNWMNEIIAGIKDVLDLDTEYSPFLNKYHLELNTDEIHLSDEKGNLYNKSILIIDEEGSHNECSYIMEMDEDRLDILTTYYGNYPIHKTSRLALKEIEDDVKNRKYISFLEILISDYIKPEILITFSENIGKCIKKQFKIELENTFDGTKLWSGFIKLKDKYFFIYCLPNLASSIIHSNEIYDFIMSSRVYEFQTSFHINEILKADKTFIFPKNFLENYSVRESIKHFPEFNFLSMISLYNREGISEIANLINEFDIYDLIIAQDLNDYRTIGSLNLSKVQYLELRKNESSEAICRKYFDETKLKYKHYILKLALVRLYLYINYPQESFDADWEVHRQKAEDIMDNYKDAIENFKMKK